MFRSAVFKLTAAYLAIIMAISIIFSVVLYRVAVQELQTGFQNQYLRWFDAYSNYGLRLPGAPAEELALRSHDILMQIIYFNVFVFVLTGIACYMLAKRTLRPIEAMHEQQKRFTADVSHELRTPLTALKMESEVTLLNPKASTKELRTALSSNLEEVGRMEALVNNLLLLSSMEADKLRVDFAPLDIQEITGEAIRTVNKFAESKNITIKSSVASNSALGDRASLTQLFIILLENAVKYSPQNSAVKLSHRIRGTNVFIDIKDSGIGIPPDALPHIFDRFYRADQSRAKTSTESSPGFGLGLSLAKLIADLHNGEVILSSKQGAGTTASVRLNIYQEPKTTTGLKRIRRPSISKG